MEDNGVTSLGHCPLKSSVVEHEEAMMVVTLSEALANFLLDDGLLLDQVPHCHAQVAPNSLSLSLSASPLSGYCS